MLLPFTSQFQRYQASQGIFHIVHLFLAVHLVQLLSAQSVGPSNQAPTLFAPTGEGRLQLAPPNPYPNGSGSQFRVDLVNLTSTAVSKLGPDRGANENLHFNIAFVPPNSTYRVEQFTGSTIAIIPCDQGPGFSQPVQAVTDAVTRSVPAVILYSTTKAYCNFTAGGSIPPDYVLYSTIGSSAYENIARGVLQSQNYGQSIGTQWYIGQKNVLDNVTMSSNTNGGQVGSGAGNPGNPSPSTAVAMIILYSITGVITALFLVIIVTGAIRAHRHPERYGPRNVLGRPRQSRAKGLARAMLDTLPIVKFGEKEGETAAKPTDVEMANTTISSDRSEDGDEAHGTKVPVAQLRGGEDSTATTSAGSVPTTDIQAATGAASSEPAAVTSPEEEAPGCSICTEDFEKGQDVRVLPCNHNFHPACIDPWLLNVSGTCPLCRIDLRPTETTDALSPESQLPPPLDADETTAADRRSSRRFSGFLHDILNPRRMQEASREERIAALRRFREREQRASTTEEVETRRRRRITLRLGETFGVRTRARGASPPREGSVGTAVRRSAEAGAGRSIAEESIPEEAAGAATTRIS